MFTRTAVNMPRNVILTRCRLCLRAHGSRPTQFKNAIACGLKLTWTGTTYRLLSKPVAGEILKDREVGTNPLADRIAKVATRIARGN